MSSHISGPELLISFIILLIISSFTALYAEKRGRSPVGWFILTLLFSLLATIALFLLPPLKKSDIVSPPSAPPLKPTPEGQNYQAENERLKADRLWFYLDSSHNQFGPISIIGLRELWNRGQLSLKSYVWSEGMEKWQLVEELPDLHQSLVGMKELL